MGKEQQKNYSRRMLNGDYAKFFKGKGCDVGCGQDLIRPFYADYVQPWDKEHGDAHNLEFPNKYFDWVHSSHCLEHLEDPHSALMNWVSKTKMGGHIIFTVPDFELYEQFQWPSVFNVDHKWAFTIDRNTYEVFEKVNNKLLFLPMIVNDSRLQVLRMQINDERYDYKNMKLMDQTRFGAQAEIEMILKVRG